MDNGRAVNWKDAFPGPELRDPKPTHPLMQFLTIQTIATAIEYYKDHPIGPDDIMLR